MTQATKTTQPTKLKFYIKEIYGTARIYPTGPGAALVQKLTNKLTVDQADIDSLTALGLECEFVSNPQYQQYSITTQDTNPARAGKGA